MRRRDLVIAAALPWAATSGRAAAADASPPPPDATAAAAEWLALTDAGNAAAGWAQAAARFQAAVTAAEWARAVGAVRAPLGAVVRRTVRDAQQARSLPGAPDGTYLVLRYDAVFERKAQAVETVALQHDADGRWRVAGYFIR